MANTFIPVSFSYIWQTHCQNYFYLLRFSITNKKTSIIFLFFFLFLKKIFSTKKKLEKKELLIEIKRVIDFVLEGEKKMATEAFILKESALLSLRGLKSLFMLIYAIVMVLLLPFRGRRRVSPVERSCAGGSGGGGKEEKQQHHECHRKGAVVRVPAKMVPWKNSISVKESSGGGGGVVAMRVVDQMMRRDLAIRRVMEDGDQRCLREYWLLGTKRGDTIFTQCWTPVSVEIR